MKILRPTPQDYDELLTVWEASVRSTHHFLTEENIQFYKPLVRNQYFQAVELYIIRNREGKIAAFMGLSDELIEMLFVHPDEQGKGYGKQAALEFLDDFHRSHSDDPLFISVSLENTVARKMYSDIGFQEVKEVEYFFLGKVCREIQMRKDW